MARTRRETQRRLTSDSLESLIAEALVNPFNRDTLSRIAEKLQGARGRGSPGKTGDAGTNATAVNIGCRVYNSADLTIATGTDTYLTFDSENWDNGGLHSIISNTGRITIKTAGIYLFCGAARYEANATGFRAFWFRVNGATLWGEQDIPAVNGDASASLPAAVLSLAVNDYVELGTYQNSGGNLLIKSEFANSPAIMCQLLAAA